MQMIIPCLLDNTIERGTSPLFKIALVLVRLDHVASVIANGGSAPFVLVIFGVPIRKDNERYAQCQRTKSNQ